MEEGLAATVEWYRARRSWWEPLKARAAIDESAWT
jgi:dTDP-glucose 4,6-dehydratase